MTRMLRTFQSQNISLKRTSTSSLFHINLNCFTQLNHQLIVYAWSSVASDHFNGIYHLKIKTSHYWIRQTEDYIDHWQSFLEMGLEFESILDFCISSRTGRVGHPSKMISLNVIWVMMCVCKRKFSFHFNLFSWFTWNTWALCVVGIGLLGIKRKTQ